jgi:aryl-alcohol dehydrogenase-like predicted oxidoreductase
MQTAKLGEAGPVVGALGLGCMGMSPGIYGPSDHAESIATIRAAIAAGVTLLDTGDFYGAGHNEMLISRALEGTPRSQVVLSVKFGTLRDPAGGWGGNDCRPQAVKNFLAYTLRRLGTDYVDIYRPARVDPAVPIEDTIGATADMVRRPCAAYRIVGSRRRNHPPRARGASDLRSANRIFADEPRYRGGDFAGGA